MTLNVGFLGAGPGVAALHLPTLDRLGGVFRAVHIADAGSGRAKALAERVGGRSSAGDGELLADPAVDVVAICSPPAEHGRQVLAAVAAGKRAIFCEKPLATNPEAVKEVVAACRAAGVVLMVGTNHVYDPGWLRARHLLERQGGRADSIAVTLALPPNGRYHELTSEGGPFQAPPRGRPDPSDPVVAAHVVKQLLTGLAIHDLPAIRNLAPELESIEYARFVPPIGYAVGFRASGISVQLALTMLAAGPDSLWRMTLSSQKQRLDLDYPPPFVHAGSGAVTVTEADGSITDYPSMDEDGYEAEWRHFALQLEGTTPVHYDLILADALYPLELADAVFASMMAGVPLSVPLSAPLTVVAMSPRFRAAVAELPLSARLGDPGRGAVLVVDGADPRHSSLLEAQAARAAAVIVSNPLAMPGDATRLYALRDVGVPVIIERPRVRPDVVADAVAARAGSVPTLVTIECAAPAAQLEAVLRDGLRWGALLAGGPLRHCGGGHGMFLLEADAPSAPVTVTLSLRGLADAGGFPSLRVTALGEVRSTVESGAPASGVRVTTSSAEGAMVPPRRYESSARLALRRAMEACLQGDVDDLEQLLEDQRLADKLLAADTEV